MIREAIGQAMSKANHRYSPRSSVLAVVVVVTFCRGDSDNALRDEWFRGLGDTMDTGSVCIAQPANTTL